MSEVSVVLKTKRKLKICEISERRLGDNIVKPIIITGKKRKFCNTTYVK
jgi:hypothetical protein